MHLKSRGFRSTDVSKQKDSGARCATLFEMNRRGDERIDMQLPCRVLFPEIWLGPVDGRTANIHRNGMMITCQIQPGRELPLVGATASVHVELPANENFPPRCMHCQTTLLRIEEVDNRNYHFAMLITNVDFEDTPAASLQMMELDSDTCGYIM